MKKLRIEELKVKSFITSITNRNALRGLGLGEDASAFGEDGLSGARTQPNEHGCPTYHSCLGNVNDAPAANNTQNCTPDPVNNTTPTEPQQ